MVGSDFPRRDFGIQTKEPHFINPVELMNAS